MSHALARARGGPDGYPGLVATLILVAAVACLDAGATEITEACGSRTAGCHLGLGFVLVRHPSGESVLFSLALLVGWMLIEGWRRRYRACGRLLWLPGGLVLASAVATLIDAAEGREGTRWLDPVGLPP